MVQSIIHRAKGICSVAVLSGLLALSGWAAPVNAADTEYRVRFNSTLTRSETEVCFQDRIPRFLITGNRSAVRLFEGVETEGGRVKGTSNRLYLHPEDDRLCLTITQRFDAQSSSYDWRQQRRGAMWFGRDLVVPIGYWLWRPSRLAPGDTLRLRFDLPDGVNISAPWPQDAQGRFVIDHRMPYNWTGRMALGRFTPQPVMLGEHTLQVAMVGGLERRGNLLNWLQQAADAVADVSGYFPMAETQVLVLPVGPDKEAVPWAEIQRQGRPAVHFFVDQTRPIYEFTSDWTAVHEFSHLLHPYIMRNDAWLFEGIASYYQNIARARSGMLSERQAWQKLYDGFQRGTQRMGGEVLRDSDAIMQIYWGGAAFVLLADVELRQRSHGQHSMASLLHELRSCCGKDMGPWSAKALLSKLETLSGETMLMDLYRQQVVSRSFPAVYPVLARLGVKVRNGQVWLDDSAPLAHLRKAIIHQPSMMVKAP